MGWPNQITRELQIFKDRQMELTIQGGCLLWGTRVIIPSILQKQVLESLHISHPGITRMKATARSHFWWHGLDSDIERVGKSCHTCQANQPNPVQAPLHPWVWPDQPWKRIHIDFAGPFRGLTFMVIVDAHSKWPEAEIMSSTSSSKTIEVLRSMFARYGIPEQLVSDNGPQFTSDEFQQFMKGNGIKHIRSAPYHPASNGQAERFVQTLKRSLKASEQDQKTIQHRLAEFVFEYRSTPQSTTKESPCNLFLKRCLRTRFHLMKPDTNRVVTNKQADYKSHRDQHSSSRKLLPGNTVMVRVYNGPNKWSPGVVLQQLGPVTYTVEVQGKICKRHIDQLRIKDVYAGSSPEFPGHIVEDNFYPSSSSTTKMSSTPTTPQSELPAQTNPVPRYPIRHRAPPVRYGCSVPP